MLDPKINQHRTKKLNYCGHSLLEALIALLVFSVLATAAVKLSYSSLKQSNYYLARYWEEEGSQNWQPKDLRLGKCTIRGAASISEKVVKCVKKGGPPETAQIYLRIEQQ